MMTVIGLESALFSNVALWTSKCEHNGGALKTDVIRTCAASATLVVTSADLHRGMDIVDDCCGDDEEDI